MHETMKELLDPLKGILDYSQTDGAVRVGQKAKGQQRGRARPNKPRPIKLFCSTRLQKGEIFRGLTELKKNQKFADLSLANDLDNDKMIGRKEVYSIFIAAKKLPNVQVKMRGDSIEIDGKLYSLNQFHNLPHNLSLEAASMVQTPNGVAFQGHGAPASSLYQCEIDDGQRIYNCVEQQFVYYKAIDCSVYVAAANVLCESNPYTILDIGKSIVTTREWEEAEVNVLKSCHRQKLTQNPVIKDKLKSFNTTTFYEATYHKTYGAGFSLENAEDCTAKPPGGYRNELGRIIGELLTELDP